MVQNGSGYQSFSVLGMSLIFALGGAIIILGLSVDLLAAKFGAEHSKFRREQWDAEETMALHENVYAANGHESEDWDRELPAITSFASTSGRKNKDAENQPAAGEEDSGEEDAGEEDAGEEDATAVVEAME
jgi:hypothetical protein